MKYNKFVTHTRKHAILFPMRQHFLSILTHYIEDIFVIYFLTTFFICNLNLSLPIYINKPCINIYILYYCCNYCKYFSIMLIIIYFYKRHYCFIFIFLVTYLFYMFSDLDKEINKSIQLKEAYLHQLRKNKQIKEEIYKQHDIKLFVIVVTTSLSGKYLILYTIIIIIALAQYLKFAKFVR